MKEKRKKERERERGKRLKGGSKVCLRSFECWPPLSRLRLFAGWEGYVLPRSKGLRKEQGLLAQLTLNWLGSLPASPPPITHLSSLRGYPLITQLYTRLNVIANGLELGSFYWKREKESQLKTSERRKFGEGIILETGVGMFTISRFCSWLAS